MHEHGITRPPSGPGRPIPGGAAPRSTSSTCAASPTATATASATWRACGRTCRTWPRSASTRSGSTRGTRRRWPTPATTSPTTASIDPVFGTLADADALIAEAHAHGHQDHRRHRAQPRLRPASLVRRGAAAGPGSAERSRFWFRPGRGAGRRAAAEQLAVDLRRARLDPGHRAGRLAGRVVPAPVRARAAGLQLGATPTCGASSRTCCGSGSPAAWTASGSTRPRCCARTRRCPTSPLTPARARAPVHRPGRRARDLPVLAGRRRRLPGPDADRRGLAARRRAARPLRRPRRAAHGLQLPVPELPVGRRRAARRSSTRRWRSTRRSARRPPGCCPTTTSTGSCPGTAGPTPRSTWSGGRTSTASPSTWRSAPAAPGRRRC